MKVYETHFEFAARLNATPDEIYQRALRGEFPACGFSGGVCYLPTIAGPDAMDFFVKLIAVRHRL